MTETIETKTVFETETKPETKPKTGRPSIGVTCETHTRLSKLATDHDLSAAIIITTLFEVLDSHPNATKAFNAALEKRSAAAKARGPIAGMKGKLLRQIAKDLTVEELQELVAKRTC